MKRVGILLSSDITESTFSSRVVPSIIPFMQDPDVQFVFPLKPLCLLRYMQNRKYRNCVVYLTTEEKIHPIITKMIYNVIRIQQEQISISIRDQCDTVIVYESSEDEVKLKMKF